MKKWSLTYSRCPHGVGAISLDDEGGGVRLTRPKCCGRWDTIQSFPLDARQLQGIIEEATAALESLE